MSFTVNGLLGVENMILELDVNTRRRVNSVMHEQAIALRDLARAMAPVDEGNLEEAIKVSPDEDVDVFGMRNVEYRIYIDMDMEAPHHNADGSVTKGTEDKVVGDYAYYVHEYVTPAGNNQLGPESQLKQEANGDVEVGGGFMTRAAEEIEKTIIQQITFDTAPAPRWSTSRTNGRYRLYTQPRSPNGRFASKGRR